MVRYISAFAMILLVWVLSIVYTALAGNVLQLTDSNFKDEIGRHPFIMVKFYAPWCGHCKKLAPEYEKAADRLLKLDPPVYLAEVDCTTEKVVCSENGVSGYPTLITSRYGIDQKPYEGHRTADAIYDYMTVHTQPAASEIQSKDDLEKVDIRKPTVVAFVLSKEDSFFKLFNDVASDLRGSCIFMYSFDASVLDVSDNHNFLRLYRPKFMYLRLDSPKDDFVGDFSFSSVKEWILRNGYGLVGYRTDSNQEFFNPKAILTLYYNATAETHPVGVNYYRNRLIKAIKEADALNSGLTFSYCSLETCRGEVNEFGYLDEDDLPIVGIKAGGKKFKMDKYSHDALVDFLKKYMNGKLTPHLKSEPIPASQPDNVWKVVAANFDEIVNDPTRDVMIAFVASWCGHCKALKPKFESAAGKLKKEPSIIFASMDATENDVPSPYIVNGFPTIYFVTKENKEHPLLYQGGRDEDDFIKFVAERSSTGLVGYDRQGKLKKSEL